MNVGKFQDKNSIRIDRAYRDMKPLRPLPTGVPFRFPAAVAVPSVSAIGDAILERVSWKSPRVVRELRVLFGSMEESDGLVEWTREKAAQHVGALWREIQEVEREVFGRDFWRITTEADSTCPRPNHQPNAIYDRGLPPTFYEKEIEEFTSPAVRPGRGEKIMRFRFDPGNTCRVFTVSELPIRQDSAGDIGASEHSRQSSTTFGEVQTRLPLASSDSLSTQRRRPTTTSSRLG